jgi:WD40 repeat protein
MTKTLLPQSPAAARDLVFISYSHRDRDWLARLLTFLKVYTSLDVWADKYIEVGGQWRRDIATALSCSSVGVLLVSDHFLASDFIRNEELPQLLRASEAGEITLFAIPISTSGYRATPLADFQFAHSPDDPLDGIRVPKRNAAFARLAEQIAVAAQKAARPLPRLRSERAAVAPLAPVAQTGQFAVLHGVPNQRPHHLRRPEYFAPLKKALLGATEQTIGITGTRIGLHGMGGIGKTVLAIDLVNDDQVRRAFADGVFWLTLGQSVDPLQLQVRLAGYLSGETNAFATDHEARDRLRQLFEGKSCLLVLDDLWRFRDAEPFDVLGSGSRLLVTTRDADLLVRLGAGEVSLGVPDEPSSLELLATFSGQARDTLPATARKVVENCGHLPLALAVAGAQIRGGAAWEDVLSALERGRLEFPGYGSIFNALQVSTESLASSDRDRYLELAVFPEDANVPVETICTFWRHTGRMEAPDSRELLRRLHRQALLIRSDDGKHITFHDLQHDFLRLNIASLTAAHAALADAYHALAPSGWASGPDDGYFFQHLPQHLFAADRLDELMALLCNYDWLVAKLRATNITSALADYDLMSDDRVFELIQQALRLSSAALSGGLGQLSSQLIGRLQGAEGPAVRALIRGAERGPRQAWLRPRFASLTPPGGPLRQILVGHRSAVSAVAFLPDGSRALSGSWDNTVRLWDLPSGEMVRAFAGHVGSVEAVAVLADGRRGLSGSWDNTLRLWDLMTGDTLHILEGHIARVNSVAVLADGSRALSGSEDKTLRLWDLASGTTLRTLEGHTDQVNAVAVLANGSRALSGSDDNTLRLWDLRSGQTLRTLEGHTFAVSAVAMLADGSHALSGSYDNTLRLWDLATDETLCLLERHTSTVSAVAVLPDVSRALSGSLDSTLRLSDLETGKTLLTLEGHTAAVTAVAVLANGSRALSASSDKTLRLWDLTTGETLRALEGHASAVKAVAALPDGSLAVSGSDDRTLRLWDLATGATLRTLKGHTEWVNAVAVLSDGRRALSGSRDQTLRVWDLASGETLSTLEGHISWVRAVAVSADGGSAVSGSDDRTLRLWDLTNGVALRTLEGHTSTVFAVAISADGKCALSGSFDHTLRLWDLTSGECVAEYTADGPIYSVGFVRDDLVVAGSADGRIHILEIREP